MTTRRKIFTVISITALVIVAFWFYWSPRAGISGDFSWRDLASIRWQVRMHTFKPILRINHNPDGTVTVYTGVQRGPLDGGGNIYEFKKTPDGWH
ncbi:MAG TPA: hypothetical protein VK815_11325, partial [Candidatus Acidoferrales bacterium]|nr:hypothetical protein [Candidatus Acidoferrales bacterium]